MGMQTDRDPSIAQYLMRFRRYYPGILEWYSGLRDALLSGQRSMFVSKRGHEIQGLAITRNGCNAKLCHISVLPTERNRGLGNALIHQALSDMVRKGARSIVVTSGEEVFYAHKPFFLAAGFRVIDWQLHRYRRGVSEIIWRLEIGTESECQHAEPLHSKQEPSYCGFAEWQFVCSDCQGISDERVLASVTQSRLFVPRRDAGLPVFSTAVLPSDNPIGNF